MYNPGTVWIEDSDRGTLENACEYITEAPVCEELRIKEARALEYNRILQEQQSLGRGLIWGGILSVSIWVVLGVLLIKSF
jgi:hypothetical protein